MRTRIIAVTELALISPAALFMSALVVRSLQPLQHEPAHSAQQLVMWYAGRMWTLWVLLLALPLTVLLTGCLALSGYRKREAAIVGPRLAMSLVAANTFAAAVILVIVVLHKLAN